MKVREIIRIVKADGWVHVTTTGSHRQFKHPVKTGRVTIPGHPRDDLPPGLERSILRQAHLRRQR
jgi:predicted RNA binding protein YcfA (HicA-like mRNA interferase family)